MRTVAAWLLPLLMLALTGCGLAEKAAERAAEEAAERAIEAATGVKVDQDGNSITIKGQDGEETTITAPDEGKLVEGFPLPVYEGGKVLSSAVFSSDSKKSWTAGFEFTVDPKAVADYYETVLKGKGVKVIRTDSNSNGSVDIMLMVDSDTVSGWIAVSKYPDSPTTANIMWGDK